MLGDGRGTAGESVARGEIGLEGTGWGGQCACLVELWKGGGLASGV